MILIIYFPVVMPKTFQSKHRQKMLRRNCHIISIAGSFPRVGVGGANTIMGSWGWGAASAGVAGGWRVARGRGVVAGVVETN